MLDIILIGVAAVLVVTLFEIVEERKRKEFIIKRLYDENHSLETKAQESVTLREAFEYEC